VIRLGSGQGKATRRLKLCSGHEDSEIELKEQLMVANATIVFISLTSDLFAYSLLLVMLSLSRPGLVFLIAFELLSLNLL
jgi:hypothetical protein